MTAYINQLILTVVVCQVAVMISPDVERAKRYIRIVCALVTILTILTPVRTLVDNAGELAESFGNFFTAAETTDNMRDSLESAAYTILTYAGENYDLNMDGAEVTFFTNDDGEAVEMQMFVKSGDSHDRDRLTAKLENELGITVHIFLERRTDDD